MPKAKKNILSTHVSKQVFEVNSGFPYNHKFLPGLDRDSWILFPKCNPILLYHQYSSVTANVSWGK